MKFYKSLTIVLLSGTCLMPQSVSAHSLPLGDGNISSSPSKGNVYSCQTNFNANAPGARASGEWLNSAQGTWDPNLKPYVDGSVTWPSEINIELQNGVRIITANGLPDHETGVFPVSRDDDAYQYDRNPNPISAQNVLLRLDATPQLAAQPSCVPMGMIGFALSGAAIYNALDARGKDAPAHEILDKCGGHPQQQGEYHYHDEPSCVADTNSGPNGHSDLLGYALDGFGIYGNSESSGVTLTSSDLDECHGHVGPIEWDGKIVEMYHYHFTEDYPYAVSCFAGEVSATPAQRMEPPRGAHNRPPNQRRHGQRPPQR